MLHTVIYTVLVGYGTFSYNCNTIFWCLIPKQLWHFPWSLLC